MPAARPLQQQDDAAKGATRKAATVPKPGARNQPRDSGSIARGHIIRVGMRPLQYALVAYVKNELGRFVEELRRELHPELEHLPAHITILPPRILAGGEAEALAELERLCGDVPPFEVGMDGVESFQPLTPTIYLAVDQEALRLHELHERLNTAALDFYEEWPYMPHLTIVKLADESRIPPAMELARKRWSAYQGPRRTLVEELTFVREGECAGHWTDLAPVQLGRSLASKPRR